MEVFLITSVEIPARPREWPIDGLENRNTQRMEIVAALKESNKALCDRAISDVTGIPLNLVNARRKELIVDGIVEFKYKQSSEYSGVRVKHWGLVK